MKNTNAPEDLLRHSLAEYSGRIALASSLSLEDQVLTDMMLKIDPAARIFTIDTGRLFPETYTLIDKTNARYNTHIEVYSPDHRTLEPFVKENGISPFYQSVELRKTCCRHRKIEPLQRALSTLDVWICGLRQEQSPTRTAIKPVEWDEANGLIKINPLATWTEQQVWNYINQNTVPHNPLHKQGYPSIGCQPCTRAIIEGEELRAGRWWWENPEQKECGLHRR